MFSVLNRAKELNCLKTQPIDLIVVGGGITGAGIALDAAERGMKVALFEKNDFASGTSSKSTKLIHGGLRYLKNLEFGLVKEVGLERAIVHRNARHIVLAEKMLLPIVKNGSLNKFFTNMALWVYDFLAQVDTNERRKMLDKEQTIKEEPLLYEKGKNLIGGGLYYEYRSDDARLSIEVLKKAKELGALAFNYIEVKDFLYEEGKIKGVQLKDHKSNKNFQLKAHTIVNATGPWVDSLRKKDKSLEKKRLLLTKGVHLVVKQQHFPIKHALYFDTPDKRMIFAIPRAGKTYIGTTDTIYNQDIEKPQVSKEDADYLLKSVNKMFPSIKLKAKQIESSWAGLRPLIYEDGKSAGEVSRKDEIFNSPTGLITIAGGKLTGYRKMAEKTVNLVRLRLLKQTGKNFGDSNTKTLKLSGGKFHQNEDITDLIIQLSGEAKQIGLEMHHIKEWVYRYGSNSPELLEIAYNEFRNIEKNPEKLMLLAELIYGIQHEMVCTISDFYIRRTSRLFFDRENIAKHLDFILLELSTRLKLDKVAIEKQKEDFLAQYNMAVDFI